jgi:hypothetical protein
MFIDNFLELRKVKRIGSTGNGNQARSRLELSKFLASNFLEYDSLRRHLSHPNHHTSFLISKSSEVLLNILMRLKWIEPGLNKDSYIFAENNSIEIRNYLFGHWLEEYVFCAFEAAGADEVFFSQKVEWIVDGVQGENEMDVIARREKIIGFVSCKAIRPEYRKKIESEMLGYVREVHDWDVHFSDGEARAMIITTLDMYYGDSAVDSMLKYPILNAKGKILNVKLLGIEQLEWTNLVEECKKFLS